MVTSGGNRLEMVNFHENSNVFCKSDDNRKLLTFCPTQISLSPLKLCRQPARGENHHWNLHHNLFITKVNVSINIMVLGSFDPIQVNVPLN